jgi:hypothetical protein
MTKRFTVLLLTMILCFAPAVSFAQSGAEKAAAASSTGLIIQPFTTAPSVVTPWMPALTTSIKPPGGKDLFIGFSTQTLILTENENLNLPPGFSFTFANEGVTIQVRVLVDSTSTANVLPPGVLADPGVLTYDSQIRTTEQETINSTDVLFLALQLAGVRSFNFVKHDVGVGTHTVQAQIRFIANNTTFAFNGFAFSGVFAVVGARTLTVEEVKLDAQ